MPEMASPRIDVVEPVDKLALAAGTVKEVHGILGEAISLITAAPYAILRIADVQGRR